MSNDEYEEGSFLRRNRLGVIITIIFLAVFALLVFTMLHAAGNSSRRTSDVVMIKLPPPPPQTPPPPPTPEQKMQDQHEEKINIPEEKPKDIPEKPPDEPPIGTNIKGDGQGDSFGLSGSAGNGFGGGGGSRFDWYAGQVQRRIADALRNNSKTREATLSVKVRVWADATGRISRAELVGSTGDTALDQALRDQVLMGLQVSEGPPDGMPMPVLLRLTARRPQ